MSEGDRALRGRGSSSNPANRFEKLHYERDPDAPPGEEPAPRTQFLKDRTGSLITTNDSPDVGFAASINPYRGCEHGCVYCYARPYHEYLGFSAGLDFETKILVKEDAPRLLRKELNSPHWKPQVLGLSGVTDAYQPIERHLLLTRRCLEVLALFRNPVVVVTKNHLVTRDADLLARLAETRAAVVCLSVTTLEDRLAGELEPRATRPRGRLEAIRQLSTAGVPVSVLVAPIIPGLNDHEIPAILAAAREAGAVHAGYVMLRLPHGLPELFGQWLRAHYPERMERVLSRLREVRDGNLNDPRFGSRMRGQGPIADAIATLFRLTYRKLGFPGRPELSSEAFVRPDETPPLLLGPEASNERADSRGWS
jgi:DNA repair photolyase